jgi:hypothetical protein
MRKSDMRRALLATLFATLISFPSLAGDGKLVVVELFTSQGCYSCPPADRFAGKLQQREDVLPLSYHVDYWDYIGWKDPFALPGNDDRQRSYAASFGLHSIYTPQMVVGGQREGVGSRESNIEKLIEAVRRDGRFEAFPALARDANGGLVATIPPAGYRGSAAVFFVAYEREKTQVIPRGENAGKTLTYYNVVRDFNRIGSWQGAAETIEIGPLSSLPEGADGGAVLVQELRTGAIIGAARIPL